MQIEKRTMGWIQKPSAYDYNQQINDKRREQAQAYLNEQTALSSAIFSTTDTFSHDMTALVLQNVVSRVTSQAEEKVATAVPDDLLTQLSSQIDKVA